MILSPTEFILYVADQQAAQNFYAEVLQLQPALDVPGMTEFNITAHCKLGLMPENGIAKILEPAMPHPAKGQGLPRCELYLLVDDVNAYAGRAKKAGAKIISEAAPRDWGHTVAYFADADGHVIAFASAERE
ncbi:MAG: lactoylglutathione lyase-like lyase [Bacteroidetes bacterium]|nr:MAG: lactoylglutathione lyase-like lyase [Bacteroidota bacterium]